MNREMRSNTSPDMGLHLTAEQMAELLDAGPQHRPDPALEGARQHIEHCAACSSEFASLQEVVALFRTSTVEYASRQLAAGTRERLRTRRASAHLHTAFWPRYAWAAAGLLLAAAVVPLRLHQQEPKIAEEIVSSSISRATQTHESDAALLEDISRDVSASVPRSMQSLADPTASSSATEGSQSIPRKN